MKIGSNIRKVRQYKDIKQEDIAHQLGLSVSAYSKIERDETEISVDRLIHISKILDVDYNSLIGSENGVSLNNVSFSNSSNSPIGNNNNNNNSVHPTLIQLIEKLIHNIDIQNQVLSKIMNKEK